MKQGIRNTPIDVNYASNCNQPTTFDRYTEWEKNRDAATTKQSAPFNREKEFSRSARFESACRGKSSAYLHSFDQNNRYYRATFNYDAAITLDKRTSAAVE